MATLRERRQGAAGDARSKWENASTAGGGSRMEKNDVLDAVYWARQVVAVLIGLVWGAAGFTGFAAIVAFGAVSVAAVIFYYSRFLGVDPEEHGGAWELVKEGMMPSFGAFLATWTCSYTILTSDTSNLY